jgi:hypothetical protein
VAESTKDGFGYDWEKEERRNPLPEMWKEDRSE